MLTETTARVATKKGICEVCPDGPTNIDKELFYHDKMWLCVTCRDAHLTSKKEAVNKIVEDIRKYDTPTNMKTDVHLARTIPITELSAKIEQDENIPADMKNAAFVDAGYAKFIALKKAIFDKMASLAEDQDEAKLWQVNLQERIGKLRVEQRAQYAELNISYPAAPITKKQKSTKPVKTSKESGKSFSKKEFLEALEKYGVSNHAHTARMLMYSNHSWSYEKAAQETARMMGVIKN